MDFASSRGRMYPGSGAEGAGCCSGYTCMFAVGCTVWLCQTQMAHVCKPPSGVGQFAVGVLMGGRMT